MAAGQPWLNMPEVESVHRLRAGGADLKAGNDPALPDSVRSAQHLVSLGGIDRAARLFLTFIAAMDRARDANQPWNAGYTTWKITLRASIHSMWPSSSLTSFAGC